MTSLSEAERRTLICALRGWERHFLSRPALMESVAGMEEMHRTRELIERLQEEDTDELKEAR